MDICVYVCVHIGWLIIHCACIGRWHLLQVESAVSSNSSSAVRNPCIASLDDAVVADLARLAIRMCASEPLQRPNINEVLKAIIAKNLV